MSFWVNLETQIAFHFLMMNMQMSYGTPEELAWLSIAAVKLGSSLYRFSVCLVRGFEISALDSNIWVQLQSLCSFDYKQTFVYIQMCVCVRVFVTYENNVSTTDVLVWAF